MENYPKRSLTDMIVYCEYAMEEEKDKRVECNGGHSRRYKMAKEMRSVLMDIRTKKTRRNYHGREATH